MKLTFTILSTRFNVHGALDALQDDTARFTDRHASEEGHPTFRYLADVELLTYEGPREIFKHDGPYDSIISCFGSLASADGALETYITDHPEFDWHEVPMEYYRTCDPVNLYTPLTKMDLMFVESDGARLHLADDMENAVLHGLQHLEVINPQAMVKASHMITLRNALAEVDHSTTASSDLAASLEYAIRHLSRELKNDVLQNLDAVIVAH